MKRKNYSKAVETRANSLLSEYNLTLDQLTQPQRQLFLRRVFVQKWLPLGLILFTISLVITSWGCWVKYDKSLDFIQKTAEATSSGTPISLEQFGNTSMDYGISVGMYGLSAIIYFIAVILITVNIIAQKYYLQSLLSAFKPTQNDQTV